MKKLLFISTNRLTKLGGVRRLYLNLKFFAKQFSVHYLYIHVDNEKPSAELDVPEGIKFKQINASSRAFDFFCFLFPQFARRLMLVRSTKTQVQDYIDSKKIDVVILHSMDCVIGLRDIKSKVLVAELLDSFYTYYESKYRSTMSLFNLLLMKFQKISYRFTELIINDNFNLFVFVSLIDAKTSHLDRAKIIVSEIRQPPEKIRKYYRKYDVCIIGRWNHPPNRDGLKNIVNCLEKIHGSIIIVGPGLEGLNKLKLSKNVKIIGFIDNIEDVLFNTKVCLIPVWYGAGIQNKAFDALRCGCVIVSTRFTQKTLEENGFFSDAAYYSDDIISMTNEVLMYWNKSIVDRAYNSYAKWYRKSLDGVKDYLTKIKILAAENDLISNKK